MATISGLSGGRVDVASIVNQLMTVERQPIDRLNRKSASYQTQLSVFASVRSGVAKFQAAVQSLKSTGSFQAFTLTSSDQTSATASAGSTAVPGTYAVEVTTLAKSQQLVAVGRASKTDAIGAGGTTTISFDFGTISNGTFNPTTGQYTGADFNSNGGGIKTVTIDNTNNTLEGIRDAINKANIGVSATIINDGSATPHRLSLTSTEGGVTNSMSISVSGESDIANLLNHAPNGTQNLSETLTAQNANFKVNGVPVTKTSNTVTDAIQGVTLNLKKENSATSLVITKDTAAINAAANSFVSAYNELIGNLKSISAYKTATTSAGSLSGDPAVRQMISELRDILSGTVSGGSFSTLADVGIRTQPNVGLALDTSLFESAVTNNLTDLSNLFTSSEGFATKLDAWAKSSLNVTINTRTSNINQSISDIAKQVESQEVRMTSLKKRYTAQFTNLNTVLAQLSSAQSFFSAS